MHPWSRWIRWLNPATYSLQALLATEMENRVLDCVEPQLVPYGPGYDDKASQSCTIAGSASGSTVIVGEDYIDCCCNSSSGIIWRNFGIIIALWVFFAIIAAIGFEMQLATSSGSRVLFDRRARRRAGSNQDDAEKCVTAPRQEPQHGPNIVSESTTFTFKNIRYFVHHDGIEKQLLNDVSGFVKP